MMNTCCRFLIRCHCSTGSCLNCKYNIMSLLLISSKSSATFGHILSYKAAACARGRETSQLSHGYTLILCCSNNVRFMCDYF